MAEILAAALGVPASSPYVQFAAFLMMGLAVSWLFEQPRGLSSWSPSLAMIGVCGAWLGAEFAYLIGQAERGGEEQFLAALIGAAALAHAWRRFHPRSSDDGHDVAIQRSHA